MPAGEDWRPEKSSGGVINLHCEECTVVPRGTWNTKIRYREYKGGSAKQVHSGLGDYWGHLLSSTFPIKDDLCQKSCLQHSPCRQMRLSSQDCSGVRCSVVTSSETRVDWVWTQPFLADKICEQPLSIKEQIENFPFVVGKNLGQSTHNVERWWIT